MLFTKTARFLFFSFPRLTTTPAMAVDDSIKMRAKISEMPCNPSISYTQLD